jgi:hypothetical protein
MKTYSSRIIQQLKQINRGYSAEYCYITRTKLDFDSYFLSPDSVTPEFLLYKSLRINSYLKISSNGKSIFSDYLLPITKLIP